MSTDRAKLEEALRHGDERYSGDSYVKLTDDHWFTLRAAAEAHLATLPRTKMVEVWRVEYCTEHPEGWVPKADHHTARESADARAEVLARFSDVRCVRVTGPHQQEIPQ